MPIDELKELLNLGPRRGMIVHEISTVKAKVSQIKEACRLHPTNPIAVVYQKAVESLPDDYSVSVDKVDFQCLLENGTVNRRVSVEDGREIVRKEIDKGTALTPDPIPAHKKPKRDKKEE